MADRETNLTNFARTTLTAEMGSTDLTVTVDATGAFPASPAILVLEPDSAANREVVLFDGTFTSTTFVTSTVGNRYLAGSALPSGIVHPSGSVMICAPVAQHLDDLHDRVDATFTSADIDTLAELNAIVADATLDTSSATRVPTDLSVTDAKVAAAAAIAQSKIDGLVADLAAKLALAGGTLTGALVLDAAPTVDLNPASKLYADAFTVRTATGTTDTWVAGDQGKLLRYTNAGAVTATVPPNSSVAFPVGTVVNVYSAGAGGVTVAAGAGVTVRNNADALVQYDEVSLRKDGTDEWVRVG